MANYSTRTVSQDQDIITLSREEYDIFNRIYRQALKERMLSRQDEDPAIVEKITNRVDLKYVILTDGTSRVEFVVEKG